MNQSVHTANMIHVAAVFQTGEEVPRPARVDGVPVWEILPGGGPDDATIKADDNGLGCWIIPGLKGGSLPVRVTADADLGEGVVSISRTFFVDIIEEPAQRIELFFDAPTPKTNS